MLKKGNNVAVGTNIKMSKSRDLLIFIYLFYYNSVYFDA